MHPAPYLLAIAGDRGRYVVMRPTGPQKYTWRDRPPTLADAAAHLAGRLTIGGELGRQDGTTYALAWDADTTPGWLALTAAAIRLAHSGARPLLERSPANRGGHLWLLFPAPTPATAGLVTAHAHAPALEGCAERWPGAARLAIRLPGGYYQTTARGIQAAGWCPLAAVGPTGPGEWAAGPGVLAALLAQTVTPTTWVTAPPIVAAPESAPARPLTPPSPVIPEAPTTPGSRPLPVAARDPQWRAAVGTRGHTLYFWVTPHEVAAWFNAHHPARELLPPDATGYGRATWRGERTASVAYRPDGGWVDHGAGGHRADGRRDGGDPLDLFGRLHHLTRGQALRHATGEMIGAARAAVEAAAQNQCPPPAWVRAILAPAGWRYYDHLCGAGAAPDGPRSPETAPRPRCPSSGAPAPHRRSP